MLLPRHFRPHIILIGQIKRNQSESCETLSTLDASRCSKQMNFDDLLFLCLEGGKGGAAAVAERAVDPSRLDLRIGKILAAKKVSVLRRLNFTSGKIISRIDFLCKSQLKCAAKNLSQHSITFKT